MISYTSTSHRGPPDQETVSDGQEMVQTACEILQVELTRCLDAKQCHPRISINVL